MPTVLPQVTPAYEVFWRFAAERQRIYRERASNRPPPWTADPILQEYRFTSTYRAADRVSQYLIRLQQADRTRSSGDVLFRTLFFKIFNKIETWLALEDAGVSICADTFRSSESVSAVDRLLTKLRCAGPIYSPAYIMPSGGRGVKHQMHLGMLVDMHRANLTDDVVASRSLSQVYFALRRYKSVGQFLAFQWAVDLNYSVLTDHDEGGYVVAGPGAIDGISKCFASHADPVSVIMRMTEIQDVEFARFGIDFRDLWGRPLQPVDVQNCFCETSKYTRVSHPEISGVQGRTRIKQRYAVHPDPLPQPFFPPKWRINQAVLSELRSGLT